MAQATDAATTVERTFHGRSLSSSRAQAFKAYKDILLYAPINTRLPGTQPTLKGVADSGFAVSLMFAMLGRNQIEIQSQVAGDVVRTTITYDTISPYIGGRAPQVANTPQTAPLPSPLLRDADVAFGTWSDAVTVTVQA